MKNEMDLRIQKTRKNIQNAFITLLKEKPLPDISVTDICRIALCNRNTFYRYYANKEAVLEELTEACVSEIVNGTRALVNDVDLIKSSVILSYVENIVNAAFRTKDLLSLLLQYGNQDLSLLLTDALYQIMMENTVMVAPERAQDIKIRFYCRYMAGGIVSFIIYWTQNPQISKKDAIQLLQDFHSPVIQDFTEALKSEM